jgi:hypothetical protein
MITEKGLLVTQVGRDLGIDRTLLTKWKHKKKLVGPVTVNRVVKSSIAFGWLLNKVRRGAPDGLRSRHALETTARRQ